MQIQLSDHFTYQKLLRFVLPSIVMMVFTSIYGVVDGLFVSNFAGKTPFAAINLVMPFIMVLGGIGFMIGTGGTALVSKVLGEGEPEKAKRYFTMMILFTLLVGAVLTVFGVTMMEKVARFFGATDEMLHDCVLYGRIVISFTAAFMLQNVFQSFLIAAEKPKLGLIATVAAGVTNMALDALFIAGFHWGVAGAAIATVAAQLISTLGCFLYAFLKYPELRLHREDWRITRRDVTRHLIQGIPLGLQFSVLAIGIIVMQSVIVQFDTLGGEMVSNAAQNGFGAANKLNNLLMTPLNGLGAAMTSFTAQNLGAGDHARIKKGTVQALIIVWTMCLISIAAGLLLSRGGGYLYIFLSPDKVTAETMRYGNTYLYVDLSLYLFLGFIFVVRNCVQGIGKPQFVLGAGAAELAARVSVCLLLPPLIAGGAVNSDAPRAAVYALCFADPFAWMAADTVLLVPFLRNIMKMDYRYLKGTM